MFSCRKFGSAVLFGALVTGCAGTDHQLPEISDVDRSIALQEISAAPNLKPTTRSFLENERLARKSLQRLQEAADPVCKELGREGCWYTLEFSPKGEVNAGILNNQMVFHNGLAQYLESEDEFAAVIGHEIGHHIAEHREERKQNQLVGAMVAGLIFGGLAGATNAYQYRPYSMQYDMNQAMNLGAKLGQISYSKEQEREADYLGAYLMTRAGYNPEVARKVWIKFGKFSGKTKTGLMDTHPASPDRLAAWKGAVQEVRFSADLMPNAAGSDSEPLLQVARTFAAPSPADNPVEVAATAVDAPAARPVETAALRPSQGLSMESAESLVPIRASAPLLRPADSTWSGQGSQSSCGTPWSLQVAVLGQQVSGSFLWSDVVYDLHGQLDQDGRVRRAQASKSRGYGNKLGPRFLEVNLAFRQDQAEGNFAISSNSNLSCYTKMTLKRM